jgi:hypothetical protein
MFRAAFSLFAFTALAAGCSTFSTSYDGRWSADIPAQDTCPAVHWDIDVKGNSLVGAAKNSRGSVPILGTLDDSGHGTIKINRTGGTIHFGEDTFTADYTNACGDHHVEGLKFKPEIPQPPQTSGK